MSIKKDNHTCSECDNFVTGESKRGHCHLNPPVMSKRDDQCDPFPMVDGCGKGCSYHSKRKSAKK